MIERGIVMKKIRRAKSISDLLEIAFKQCRKQKCRICMVFNNPKHVRWIANEGITFKLPYARYDSGRLEIRFERDKDGYSKIDIMSPAYSYMRGRRYDYVLIDSSLSDDDKCIIKAMTVRNYWFITNKKISYRKDKRKNIIQEFTLAEEWPLLK